MAKELTEEEKQQILHSEEFLIFFDRTIRVIERALAEDSDIFFDYSGRELEEKDGGGAEEGLTEKNGHIKFTNQRRNNLFGSQVIQSEQEPYKLSDAGCKPAVEANKQRNGEDVQAGANLSFNRQFYDEHWSKHRVVTCMDWSLQHTVHGHAETKTSRVCPATFRRCVDLTNRLLFFSGPLCQLGPVSQFKVYNIQVRECDWLS
ncbi:hypothetical protein P7K49_025336 [Saguinus oedipus]|uniref:Uncharacterized protein n=1 Tax=Saguinus oedipus TaxID=9490 RepID=A0ABQ9UGU3_SAGOE|nr:hypothetical protein P7K49_025336 [Saguinus oedipus]